MKTYNNLSLLLLRIGFAGLMLTHGIPKLLQLLQGNFEFGDPIGIGAIASLILTVFAEAICSLFILVGYKTRLACIPLIITMLVAVFIVHGNDPLGRKELDLLYLTAFVVIALIGPGKFSIDRR